MLAGSHRTSGRQRLALLAFGCLLGLLLAEAGARVVALVAEQAVRADWNRIARGTGEPTEPPAETRLGHLMRAHDDPRIVYELIPNLRARFLGVDVEMNEQGFRDAPWPPRFRRPGTFRVVGLGDSVMFGWGVERHETFLARLERKLAARLPDFRIEVMNLAVPGYNTAMEVAAFERKALAYGPDLVLIDYVGNDADLPNFIAHQSHFLDLDKSFLWELLRKLCGQRSAFRHRPLQDAPLAGSYFESSPERVPPAYRDLVGEAGVTRALRRLAGLAELHGFSVAVTCHHRAPAFVTALCSDLGVPCIENVTRIEAYLGERSDRYTESELVLGSADPHPSALGHELYAETILAGLEAHGLLPSGQPR